MKVKGFSHVAIRVSDLSRSARFYEDLLDLKRIIDLPDVIVLLHAGGTMLGSSGETDRRLLTRSMRVLAHIHTFNDADIIERTIASPLGPASRRA